MEIIKNFKIKKLDNKK